MRCSRPPGHNRIHQEVMELCATVERQAEIINRFMARFDAQGIPIPPQPGNQNPQPPLQQQNPPPPPE